MSPIAAVFFDIGGRSPIATPPDGSCRSTSPRAAPAARESLGLRVGVTTNLPATLSDDQIRAMPKDTGLLPFVDPSGLVTNHAAGVDKPDPRIYQFAASRFGLPVGCLYVGEDPDEVRGAADAGMSAVLEPARPEVARPVSIMQGRCAGRHQPNKKKPLNRNPL